MIKALYRTNKQLVCSELTVIQSITVSLDNGEKFQLLFITNNFGVELNCLLPYSFKDEFDKIVKEAYMSERIDLTQFVFILNDDMNMDIEGDEDWKFVSLKCNPTNGYPLEK